MIEIKTADLRESFLSFFERNGHKRLPSSPVIPFDDPTLLFTNAGMNQFKDVFTGQRQVDYKRAVSSQKCIRAGGKHNDLDNVGFTARHHTFFEMLGNFSFGDYFKEEAIKFAWEWLTKELKLPASRLYATVYQEDDDAFALWEKIAPELKNGRILRFGKKDNYWSMGELGPCGPCSEIHFDRGKKYGSGTNDVVNGETDRFAEIWNLVFMQYDQLPGGKIVDLPKPSVDTGAGLERLAAIVQNVETNYHIDLFKNIIAAISEITKSDYKKNLASHHVIADHLRALTFAIADGAGISNEGQGYVLRRILRRAARHGRNLGMNEPFIYKLVPVLVEEMAQAYPEIKEKRPHIINVIHAEEESFGRTLETGLHHIEEIVDDLKNSKTRVFPGEEVFRLYDTYGFPYDLTEIIAAEHGLTLDKDGFDKAMQRQQEQSRKPISSKDWSGEIGNQPNMYGMQTPPTEFVREDFKVETKLEFVQVFRHTTLSSEKTEDIVMILTKTPFYLESGGQISDTGKIYNDKILIEVNGIGKQRDWYLHYGRLVKGSYDDIKNGINVKAEVNSERRWDIMRNHTATHLAQAALRKVLGTHVRQSGSYVGPDRLRFDFSHHQPLTPDEIRQVEEIVNGEIIKGSGVNTELMPLAKAKKTGAMALFGEKYADDVRVVSIDDFSKELCGGTHVENVGQIGPFIITLETGVASGVRRLEAVTGTEALTLMLSDKNHMRQIGTLVGRQADDIIEGVKQLKESNSSLLRELKKVKANMFSGSESRIGESTEIDGVNMLTHDFGETDKDIMAGWIDKQKDSA
ncbi:MAG: alanine--tRNA ligase, partial [candidate division Zixibacteria bacterium]|nr:alanine--tRNA ligase [candidate division Zixibacteria bacterium]